jgi:hypothetical protein
LIPQLTYITLLSSVVLWAKADSSLHGWLPDAMEGLTTVSVNPRSNDGYWGSLPCARPFSMFVATRYPGARNEYT